MVGEEIVPFIGVQRRLPSAQSYSTVLARISAILGAEPISLSVMLNMETVNRADNLKSVRYRHDDQGAFVLLRMTDLSELTSRSSEAKRMARFEIGHPKLMQSMFHHEVLSALFAPIGIMLIEERVETTCSLNYVVPSTLTVLGANSRLATEAKELDVQVQELVGRLASGE